MTDRLRLAWPDRAAFAQRTEPIRLLAVSDEPDPSLESAATRRQLGEIEMIIGCGDLEPEYLRFVADAFGVPLRYVRGNHDVGAAWRHAETELIPEPLSDGEVTREGELRLLGFSGSPRYSDRGLEVSAAQMWLRAWLASWRARGAAPLLVVTHAPPRGAGDDQDLAHRGFVAFRWLAERLHPPLWLHGHTALVRRGLDARCAQLNGTLVYNCTGATLVELFPPEAG
jgi:hypothetical protein